LTTHLRCQMSHPVMPCSTISEGKNAERSPILSGNRNKVNATLACAVGSRLGSTRCSRRSSGSPLFSGRLHGFHFCYLKMSVFHYKSRIRRCRNRVELKALIGERLGDSEGSGSNIITVVQLSAILRESTTYRLESSATERYIDESHIFMLQEREIKIICLERG
jgi:hypothetical protein